MLALSFAACGKGKEPAVTTSPNTTGESVTTTEPATTESDPIAYLPGETYDGHEFTVLMTNLNADSVIVRDFEQNEGGTVLDDGIYKRNLKIMEDLDITINGIADYRSSNTGLTKVRQANSANDSVYDMCIISTYDAGRLALSGDLRNLNDYGYLDLEQEWWDQNVNRDLTVNGKLFFTAGDISLVATQAMYNIVFNKQMFDEQQWEYPYKMVEEGKWTFDKLKEYVIQISRDLDANDMMDSRDLYGLVYIHSSVIAALHMSGERMANIDENGNVVVTLNTERAEQAIVNFIELTLDKQHVYNGQTATGGISAVGMFTEGHTLFRMIEHIGFPHFRDTELEYGILPLPKTDESQDRYYTPFGGWDAAFVCVPAFTADDERTSAIMEYTAYVSSQYVTPAYYEKTLVGRYVRDDDSHDMITLQIKNRIFDIGYIYNIGGMKDMVEELSKAYSTAFASKWASYKRVTEIQVKNVNKTLHSLE